MSYGFFLALYNLKIDMLSFGHPHGNDLKGCFKDFINAFRQRFYVET
jgi:hypothetical protein